MPQIPPTPPPVLGPWHAVNAFTGDKWARLDQRGELVATVVSNHATGGRWNWLTPVDEGSATDKGSAMAAADAVMVTAGWLMKSEAEPLIS